METGNKPLQKTIFSRDLDLDAERIKLSHVVVNLRYDGVSGLVFAENKKQVLGSFNIDWTPRKNADDLIRKLEVELRQLPLDIKRSKSMHWLLSLEKFALVPAPYYVKGKGRQILDNTCRLNKGEHIYTDFWTNGEIAHVFAIPNPIIDWIKSNFHGSTFSHSATAIHRLYKFYPKSETFALLQVEDFSAEFYLAKDGQLKFYNIFPFEVEEDLLYLVLFALEQANILAPEIELKLAGKPIKGEKLYVLFETYMGNLKPVSIPEHFKVSPQIGAQEVRRAFKLLGGI